VFVLVCMRASFFCSIAIFSLSLRVYVHASVLQHCNSFRLVSFRYLGSAGSNGIQVYCLDVLQEQPRPK
jgi:hypothetical protein